MAAPHLSGYQCQFVDNVDEYECPLCLHVTREPSLTSCCGQHFCQACINRLLTDSKPCPFCKDSGFNAFLDKKQKRRVLGLKVVCSNKADGCDWVGSLGDLDSHLSVANGNCQFVTVDCSNNCGEAIQRKLLAGHLANDCLKRPYSCKYCELEATFEEIRDTHLPVCTKYPVQCPNSCQDCSIERGQLEQHIKECPLQVVECELKEMGCDVEIQRKDISKHMEESMSRHLRVMAAYSLSLQQQLTETKKSLKETREKQSATERELVNTKKQLAKSEFDNHDLRDRVQIIERQTNIKKVIVNGYSRLRGRWDEGPEFYTFPMRYRMEVNLYFCQFNSRIDFELINLKSEKDDQLQWPMRCIMTVTMLNRTADHDHYQVTRYLDVKKESCNDEIDINYKTIERPPPGVQYLVNDSLQFKVDVKLRD